jgi:hypothetical protein
MNLQHNGITCVILCTACKKMHRTPAGALIQNKDEVEKAMLISSPHHGLPP